MWRNSLRNTLLALVQETVQFRRHLRRRRVRPNPICPNSESPYVEMVQVGVKRTLRIIHHKPIKNDKKAQNADENGRNMDENAQKVNENEQKVDGKLKLDENAQKVNENGQKVDENAQNVDENAQKVDENAQNVDENAQKVDENAQKVDEKLKVDEYAQKVDEKLKFDEILRKIDEKLIVDEKLDIWANIIVQQAIKDAFTHFRQPFRHQNGIGGGIVNPCYVDEQSSECSTWGSNMADSVQFQKLNSSCDEKPLIFFIHGVGTSADVWTSQIEYFQARGYETVAVDLIGHGFSSAPYTSKSYKFKQILADVLAIFDKYSLQWNVVVGHSYGSSLASALAKKRLSKVCNLILMSGGGPVGLKRRATGFTCMTCLKTCVQPLDYCGLYSRELFYCPSSREISIPRTFEVPTYVLENFAYGQTWREGNLSFYRSITIPTLLIYGLRDPYVTLVEECEMEKAIPRSVLELIPNASHMIMLDESHRVNRLMYRFIH